MKRLISVIVALVFALTTVFAMPLTASAAKANNGPNKAEGSSAYISIIASYGADQVYGPYAHSVKGFTYSKKTNTLTIKNVKRPKAVVEVNEMGENFKIKLVGTNKLQQITVWGFGYGAGLNITGKGKLTLNKNKKAKNAISVYAEDSKGFIKIAKSVKIKAYAKKKEVFIVMDSKSKTTMTLTKKAAKKNVKTVKNAEYLAKYQPVVVFSSFTSCTPKDPEQYPGEYVFSEIWDSVTEDIGRRIYKVVPNKPEPIAVPMYDVNLDDFELGEALYDKNYYTPFAYYSLNAYSKDGVKRYILSSSIENENGERNSYDVFKSISVAGYGKVFFPVSCDLPKFPAGYKAVKTGKYFYTSTLKQKSYIQ